MRNIHSYLIKVVEPYMGKNTLGKRIEQSRVSLLIAAKMLEKMTGKSKEVLSKQKIHPYI